MNSARRGVYPGSFNPLTTAHLAIAHAARLQRDLASVTLAFSHVTLAKEGVDRPTLEHRVAVARTEAADHDGIEILVTDAQLIAEIAEGFDVVVMGADKWRQVIDPVFYDDGEHRDRALAALPELAIAPREGIDVPPDAVLDGLADVRHHSSTAARAGAVDQMARAARAFDDRTGAWTDPDRYERWLRVQDSAT